MSDDVEAAGRRLTESADALAAAADPVLALTLLRDVRAELAVLEPRLIEAARAAGVSWQSLAPALGVTSRQAAERRYLRLRPATTEQAGTTRDERVRAERDRRAGSRAVAQWANEHTAGLRRLAGRITALTDLDDAAAGDVGRLQDALADADATALPALLAGTHRHLQGHPGLAGEVEAVTADADGVRRRTQRDRDDPAPGLRGPGG